MTALTIQSLPSCLNEARRLSDRLRVPITEIKLHRFPDGELKVTAGPPSPTTVIYASLDQPNEKLIAILFAVEALRRGGAKRIVLVAPYLCYMRQDSPFNPGEAVSQKAIGRVLADAVDRIITIEAHLHRTPDIAAVFPGIRADNLSAIPAIADHLKRDGLTPATVIVGPDEESKPWVSALAAALDLPWVAARKQRRGDRSVEIVFDDPAKIAGRSAIIVDDIVSSGGTLVTCAEALRAAGATAVDAIVVHALFPASLLGGFEQAGIRSIRSTTTVAHPTNAISTTEILAAALRDELDHQTASDAQP